MKNHRPIIEALNMQIKSDLFRHLNFELSRNEVKTKLDQAALNQKENLNVDINQKAFLNDENNSKKKKEKNEQNKKGKKLQLIENKKGPNTDSSEEEEFTKALVKKLNWL